MLTGLVIRVNTRVIIDGILSLNSATINGSRHLRIDQVKFKEDSLSKPYQFTFCNGCLPLILFGLFLSALTQMKVPIVEVFFKKRF